MNAKMRILYPTSYYARWDQLESEYKWTNFYQGAVVFLTLNCSVRETETDILVY